MHRILMTAGLIASACGLATGQSVESLDGAIGSNGAIAWDINNNGTMVGQSMFMDKEGGESVMATVWHGAGLGSSIAGVDGSVSSAAYGINDNGQVVGYSEFSNFLRTATLWSDPTGARSGRDLGAEMGATGSSVAWAINERGTVAGQGALGLGPFSKGFVWSEANGGQEAGTLYQGGANLAINNHDVVVGHSFFFGDPSQATVGLPDDRGGYTVGEFGYPGFTFSIATAINDSGMIVGHTSLGVDTGWQAAIMSENMAGPPGPPQLLGTLDGLATSEANDVNEHGMVVGYSWDSTGTGANSRAWAWNDGTMYDLNSLLDENSSFALLVEAKGVNDNGDIVGWGVLRDGTYAGFVVRGFVPAPGTLGALSIGIGVACRRRRS